MIIYDKAHLTCQIQGKKRRKLRKVEGCDNLKQEAHTS